MATGGVDVYSRVTCSVCLEPYAGREAKILPCFHTFCLPCVAGLVKRRETTEASDTSGLVADEGREKPDDSLTCPACQWIIPVPAGGVIAFQTNVYLDTCKEEEDVSAVPCYLCDGEHPAQFQCIQCQNIFCLRCQRYHDKLCQGGQVRALQDPSDDNNNNNNSSSGNCTARNPSQCQVRRQLQMVEDALKKLTEEERKLNQERRAMDNSINVRYASLLGLAADARDACCLSLGEVCDGLTERLHSIMAEARQTRDTLQQQLSPSQPAPASASLVRAGLFLLGDLQMILNKDLDSCSRLQHHMDENTSLMTDSLQSFMGNVTKSAQSPSLAQEKECSGSLQDCGTVSSAGAGAKSLNELYEQFEDLAGQVVMLQSTTTQLSQLLTTAHGKLSTEQSALLREMTTLKEKNVQMTTEQAALRREVTAMRDKHTTVDQDLAVLTAGKMSAELKKLQKDIISLQTDTSKQREITSLKEKNVQLTTEQAALWREVTAMRDKNTTVDRDLAVLTAEKMSTELKKLQKDVISLQTDTSKQATDISQLRADHDDVVAKVSCVKTDITALQGSEASVTKDVRQLKIDCGLLESNMKKARSSLNDLISGQFTLHVAIATSKFKVASLEQEVKSAEDAHRDHGKTLATLESRFVKANTQVSFHSVMSRNLTTNKVQALICDHVITNVGNGYDHQTGIFTAPLAGTYCFLATTSPCKADKTKSAKLDIVLDDQRIGHVFSLGINWSTGHAVVKMASGQKVWLRTFGDKEHLFAGLCWTRFSGMLVQADV